MYETADKTKTTSTLTKRKQNILKIQKNTVKKKKKLKTQ